jgi:soluble lytic murein transglycosylase-like protein
MQLMPATARRLGYPADDLLDPEINLEAGVRYVAELAARYTNDLALILAAYNAGEATVDRYHGVPPYRETRDYIRRIYSYLGVETAANGS